MALCDDHCQLLRQAARRSIEHGLAHGIELNIRELDYPPALQVPTATFVTLRHRGELLGCIGTLRPVRALICDVSHNAYHAAFSDMRFEPIGVAHLAALEIHISVLSALEPLRFSGEADLLAQLRVGVDGLVIAEHGSTATFLPVMWERLPDPAEFLQALKEKAGWLPDFWSDTIEAFRYTAEQV